jgi:hypothetical protein
MPPTERINFVHAQVEAYKKTHVFSAEQAALQASYLFRSSMPYALGIV